MISTTLVSIAGGAIYERYAYSLMESAGRYFHPAERVDLLILDGEEGWPKGTMMRYHRLLEDFPGTDFIFLCDADMRFESFVGAEILPRENGITATLHPGYVHAPREQFPYEIHADSAAYIAPHEGSSYFCGGFVGGSAMEMEELAVQIADIVDSDAMWDHIPRWHDESALNKVLSLYPPACVLPPSYCYPDSDSWYRSFWQSEYQRKLVAIDKTATERAGR